MLPPRLWLPTAMPSATTRLSLDDRLAYARLLLKNGEYKQAEKEFRILVDSMPDNILAQNGLKSAQMAPDWKKAGSRYQGKEDGCLQLPKSRLFTDALGR